MMGGGLYEALGGSPGKSLGRLWEVLWDGLCGID